MHRVSLFIGLGFFITTVALSMQPISINKHPNDGSNFATDTNEQGPMVEPGNTALLKANSTLAKDNQVVRWSGKGLRWRTPHDHVMIPDFEHPWPVEHDLGGAHTTFPSIHTYRSVARDINDNDIIVGHSDNGFSFIYSKPNGTQIIDGMGYAMALNNQSPPQVVGMMIEGELKWTSTYQAALWDSKQEVPTPFPIRDEQNSFAIDINEAGTAIGWYGDVPDIPWVARVLFYQVPATQPIEGNPWYSHWTAEGTGVIWDHQQTQEIGELAGYDSTIPLSINNAGVVVGFVNFTAAQLTASVPLNPDLFQQTAFIYCPDVGIRDLNTLYQRNTDYHLVRATSIDDNDNILAWGFDQSQKESPFNYRPFMITPEDIQSPCREGLTPQPTPTPMPQPIPLGKQSTALFSFATDINEQNQVVGHGNTAFLWENGRRTNLLPERYWSEAFAINNNGTVVGIAAKGGKVALWNGQAFLWKAPNNIIMIPDFDRPGSEVGDIPWTVARDVNDDDIVVGHSGSGTAFIYSESNGTQAIDGMSYAMALNNQSPPQVVGMMKRGTWPSIDYQAIRWDSEQSVPIPFPIRDGHESFVTDINDAGTAIGWYGSASSIVNWLFRAPDYRVPVPWLFLFPRYRVEAPYLDEDGGFLGDVWTSSNWQAEGTGVIWQNQQTQEIGILGGYSSTIPLSINNKGVVVGFANSIEEPFADGASRQTLSDLVGPASNIYPPAAFIYDPDKGIRDLNHVYPQTNGYHLISATSINDEGYIVAWGFNLLEKESANDYRPFLLPPDNRQPTGSYRFVWQQDAIQFTPLNQVASATFSVQGNNTLNAKRPILVIEYDQQTLSLKVPDGCELNPPFIQCQLLSEQTQFTLEYAPLKLGRHTIHLSLEADHILHSFHNYQAAEYLDSLSIIVNPNIPYVTDYTGESIESLYAYSQNDHGDIVGKTYPPIQTFPQTQLGFLQTQPTELFEPCPSGTCLWQEFSDINNSQWFVGGQSVSPSAQQGANSDAVVHKPKANGEGWESISIPFAGTVPMNYAYAINESHQVVGFSQSETLAIRGFIWDETQGTRFFEKLTADNYAFNINDNGMVVGAVQSNQGKFQIFLWQAGSPVETFFVDAQSHNFAIAINNQGDIGGWYGDTPKRISSSLMNPMQPNAGPSAWYYRTLEPIGNAFVKTADKVHDLGPGMVYDINDQGFAVGYLRLPNHRIRDQLAWHPRYKDQQVAFLYDSRNEILMLLNELTPDNRGFDVASSINKRGDIVGWGYGNGGGGAFRLTRNGSQPTPIPTIEPTPTPAPTIQPSPTAEPTNTPMPTVMPTSTPTMVPIPTPTVEPTPTTTPATEPTSTPTVEPTPTTESTPIPTVKPTLETSPEPTPSVEKAGSMSGWLMVLLGLFGYRIRQLTLNR